MANLDWLPDELRDAGIDIYVGSDFYTHYRPYTFEPWGTIWHHTASNIKSSRDTVRRVCHDGRADVPGPIAQIVAHRSEPRIDLISTGYSNHAGKGWWPPGTNMGNRTGIGVEWDNNGVGEPAHPDAVNAVAHTLAVIHKHYGWGLDRAWTHAAYSPGRKIDPAAPYDVMGWDYHTWTLDEIRGLILPYMATDQGEEMYVPLPDLRYIDTRWNGFDTLDGGRAYTIPRPPRVPSNVKSVRINITAVNPQGRGFLTAGWWADSSLPPETSKLNFRPENAPIANEVDVFCGPDGAFKLYTNVSTDVVLDVCGYTA